MRPVKRLGEYRLTARLVEDAFGTLNRAVRVEGGAFGRHALIRRFDPRWLTAGLRQGLSESVPQSLRLGEARGLAPHCRIYHQAAEPWISYDLDPGLTLAELLNLCRAQGMALGLEHVLTVLRDLASVLEHLHDRKVDHGLLVPELVWVTYEGSVLLLDAPVAPQLRRVLGTQPVPGVEVLAQAPPSGATRDLYLLACLGWRMLTQEATVPPRAEALLASLEAWARGAEGGLPESLRSLFARMVGLERGFQDLGEFQRESGIALHLDEHAPSTFNLAFLVHTLLRDRIPAEMRTLESERAATWTVSTAVPILPEAAPQAASGPQSWRRFALAGTLLLLAGAGVILAQQRGSRETQDLRKALAESQRKQAERDQVRVDVESALQQESEHRARLQAQLAEARDEAEAEAAQARHLQAKAAVVPAPAVVPKAPPPVRPDPEPMAPLNPVKPTPPPSHTAARLLTQAPWAPPANVRGPLRLRVFVGEGGRALRALAVEGPGGAAEAAAIEAALRSGYQPALSGGKPVRAWVEIELTAK